MPTLRELYAGWSHLLLCEDVREILRRVEDELPEGELFDEVLDLRLLIDRGIEDIKRTARKAHGHDAYARSRVVA